MMKDVLLTSLICCLIRSLGTCAFNIDVASRVVFNGPSKSKFFGYSVALHSHSDKYWAIVGAPLSNVTVGSETYSKYGAAFKCEYTGSQQCSLISIDYSAPRMEQGYHIEEKSGQWLGAVVYSTGKDGKALACAPRYIWRGVPDHLASGLVHYRWLIGRCFRLNSDISHVAHNGEVNPCYGETKGNLHYGYCQAGFSAEYTVDGYDVIMGTVGPNQWKGGAILYVGGAAFIKTPFDQLEYNDYMGYAVASGKFSNLRDPEIVSGAPRADELKGKALIYDYSSEQFAVTSPLPQPKDLKTGSYFGSVICAVDLDNNQYSDVLVGAPYYTHIKDEGRVYIYLNNGKGALNLQDTVLEGDKKLNAHFGAAIASVGDLNADGFQDVAIGAPMEGDDGSGAVYIYQGSSKGIELPYSQKIIGSQVKAGIKMFGISIAGNVDVDKNRYPDIAVGAYGSENAVIMRSQTIVNVDGAIELSKQRITLESNDSLCDLEGAKLKCLNVTVVLSYSDAISATKSTDLNIKYTIDLDKDKDKLRRMFFWDELNKRKQFALETNYTLAAPNKKYRLAPKTVYLDKDEVGDVNSQLTFDVILSQPQPPCGGLCPALNARMANTFRAEIPFEKKCRNQVTCAPDLVLSGEVVFNPKSVQELRLGVVKDFVLQLTIENKASDSAYTSKIKLKHPDSLDYIGPDEGVECTRSPSDNGTTTVTCDIGNPLLGKATKSFGIKFAPGSVTENFVLEVEASSQDKDSNENDNKKTFSVAVKFEADVEIKGSSKQDRVVYQGPVRSEEEVRKSLDSVGPEVIQTLSVRNNGPSDVDGSVVTVNFPNLYSSSKSDSYLLYLLMVELDGVSGSCDAKVNPLDIKAGNATSEENTQSRKRRDTEGNTLLGCRKTQCKSFKCSLGLLKMGDSVNIILTFRLWENTLLKELDTPRAVDLETSAKVKVPDKIAQPDEDNDETTIITTASPAKTEAQKKKTPWWVILLSVLGGVLLLAGAVAVLYKLGFFKRKRVKDISSPMEENVPMNTK